MLRCFVHGDANTCSRTNFSLVLISPSGSNKKTTRKGWLFLLAPTVGFEPTTNRLTADCSTAELSRNSGGRYRNRTDIEGFAVLCMSHSANRPVRYIKYQTQSTNPFISIFLQTSIIFFNFFRFFYALVQKSVFYHNFFSYILYT